jgi:hypothetical protein
MKKFVALVLIALPATLVAQSPQEFARSLALKVDGKDALYEIELPAAAYESAARPDLGDLRVFNGAGEVVPHAFRPRVTVTTEARPAAAVSLAIFPLFGDTAKGVEGSDFRFEKSGDRIVVELKSRPEQPAPERRLIGYVADASAIDRPVRALAFALPAGRTEILARVRIEASDDLARWSLVHDAQVALLESGGQRLEQLRAEFPARRVKYLRVSWPGQRQPLELAGIAVEPGESSVSVDAPRQWKQAPGAAVGDRPGEYEFDLDGQFPIDRARFALPQQNTVAQVEMLVRARPTDPWRPVGASVAYRLNRDGAELTSPDIAIATVTERYWLLRVDQRGGGLGGGQPLLNVGWVPHRLVFVARGDGPFRLAVGSREAKPAGYAIETLVPGYKRDADLVVKRAEIDGIAPSHAAPPAPARQRSWQEVGDWKRWVLWGSLVLGVALLGALAVRLSKQMAKPADDGAATKRDRA